jgi:hypothetical protein
MNTLNQYQQTSQNYNHNDYDSERVRLFILDGSKV